MVAALVNTRREEGCAPKRTRTCAPAWGACCALSPASRCTPAPANASSSSSAAQAPGCELCAALTAILRHPSAALYNCQGPPNWTPSLGKQTSKNCALNHKNYWQQSFWQSQAKVWNCCWLICHDKLPAISLWQYSYSFFGSRTKIFCPTHGSN